MTFTLEVCDTEPFCDTDTVVINVPPMGIVDAATEVIVSGPVGPSTKKTSKSFVFKVSNEGTVPITIDGNRHHHERDCQRDGYRHG